VTDDRVLRAQFDSDADAAYVYLQPATVIQPSVARTLPVSPSINLDFDSDGRLVGVEVLGSDNLHPALLAEIAKSA
jgi:uncharacterized protein YuzE